MTIKLQSWTSKNILKVKTKSFVRDCKEKNIPLHNYFLPPDIELTLRIFLKKN